MQKIRLYELLVTTYRRTYKGMTTNAIAQHFDMPKTTTRKYLNQLVDDNIITKTHTPTRGNTIIWKPSAMTAAVYATLLKYYRSSHDYVPTNAIAHYLNKNARWMRTYLTDLETAQLVQRHQQRGGWKPLRPNQIPTTEDRITQAIQALTKTGAPITTAQIAQQLALSERHTRRLLNAHNCRRTSQRGTWIA